jgi:hypothetical protein
MSGIIFQLLEIIFQAQCVSMGSRRSKVFEVGDEFSSHHDNFTLHRKILLRVRPKSPAFQSNLCPDPGIEDQRSVLELQVEASIEARPKCPKSLVLVSEDSSQ